MNKQYTYNVGGISCHSCEVLIKEGLVKFPNIKAIEVSSENGEVSIEYEGDNRPSSQRLNEIFQEEKFIFSDKEEQDPKLEQSTPPVQAVKVAEDKFVMKNTKEHTYKVEGMHCASCEILIEKKLLDIENVKSVDASTAKGEVVVEYQGDRPNPERLTKIFKEENYAFSDFNSKEKTKEKVKENAGDKKSSSPTLVAFNIAIFVIIAFLVLDKMGIANFLSLNSTSSVFTFFGFGILAGLSSCAALVGGIVLSMSKQWNSLYSADSSTSKRLKPHIMFNTGRVVSYIILGGVLGLIGSRLQISPQFTAYMVVGISILMVALGLQMLGVKAFQKFQITAPKSATRYIANENNFQGKYMPFIMGALTFFLPCGFTITAQSLALLSGSAVGGALIMGAFVLGTVPVLFFIGLSSVRFSSKPHLALRFSKVAGFLVLFFALYNMSNQATVLGFNGINLNTQTVDQKGLAQIIDGKQILKMTASGSKDSPNYFKVRVGVPIRWEITGANSLGCNGAIVSNKLFSGSIDLTPGQVSVKEFTIQTPGRYVFSCTMGMISGVIEAVNDESASGSQLDSNIATAAVSNGASNQNSPASAEEGLAQVVNGKQILKMTASGSGDSPNYFKVVAGTPVRWEVTAGNSLGCNNAIISNSLFSGAIDLTPGQLSVKEFTPSKPGKYGFSCTMGMITGTIEVISAGTADSTATGGNTTTASASSAADSQVIPSGATGCGCGGGGSESSGSSGSCH